MPWPSRATTHARYYLNNLKLHCKEWLGYIVVQTEGGIGAIKMPDGVVEKKFVLVNVAWPQTVS